jgi:hypothetical protein
MSVFAIQLPCDDSFYGFQLDMICDSYNNVLEQLRDRCTPAKYLYLPDAKHKYQRQNNKIKDIEENIICHKPAIYNVTEFIMNENNCCGDELMNDEFLCFRFDDMKLIYKDTDDLFSPCNKYYSILEKTDDENFLLKFIEEDKTVLLKLNKETNMLNVI